MAKKSKELSSLNTAIEKFTNSMGEGIIHTAAELPPCLKIQSSVPAYNHITCGGFPVGRVIEHLGEQGSLKSYLAYDAIAQFQHFDWANDTPNAFTKIEYTKKGYLREVESYKLKKGYKPENEPIVRRVALVDLESTYTPDWGARFGIDNEGLILIRPTLLTEAVDIVQTLLGDENISLVVFDSLSAVGTDDEVDKSMGDHQMASGAKFWNKAFRKLQSAMNGNPHQQSTLLVINSAYQAVGMVFGDPERISNGNQLKRTKSLSVKFRALKGITAKTDVGELTVGHNVIIECLKNKVGVRGRSVNFFYAYTDYGNTPAYKTDVEGQIVELGIRYGLIERRGAYYVYGETKVQGLDNFVKYIIDEDIIKNLSKDINEQILDLT